MKKTKKLIVKAVIAIFAFTIIALTPTTDVQAVSLINATDSLSELFQTKLAANSDLGDTTISVLNGTGITLNDVLLITDGTTSEERTVSAQPTSNTVSVDALSYSWLSSTGIDVTVLTGIQHSFAFQTTTKSRIHTLKFTFDDNSITDGASFANAGFENLSGVNGSSSGFTAGSGAIVTDDAQIEGGTPITVDIVGVRNPTGVTTTSYSITVDAIQSDGTVADTVDIYFGVDTGVLVKGDVDSILTFTIADDGNQNNPSDSVSNETIQLGTLETDTHDASGTGRGIDGNLLTVTTNASNGYNITIQDTVVGLVNAYWTGGARSDGDTDDGIDDVDTSTGTAWWNDVEAYGYYVGDSFDFGETGDSYNNPRNPLIRLIRGSDKGGGGVKITSNRIYQMYIILS